VVTGAILLLGLDRGFTPERLLLTGIAITALLDASSLLFLALGDPRSGQVLAWLSGSTYWVELNFAVVVLGAGIAGLLLAALAGRWLEILPLGASMATGLGVPLRAARLTVLALAAVTTAAAALIVGPMSFVGLLAPHLAGLIGLRRAEPQLFGAAMIGSALVVFADWMGRVVFAPTELPAGVLSVLKERGGDGHGDGEAERHLRSPRGTPVSSRTEVGKLHDPPFPLCPACARLCPATGSRP
ncbi:MAG: hypothetical protein E5W93_17555, partial [Mesorhizobium sp.]